jgi:transposase InsO family protein
MTRTEKHGISLQHIQPGKPQQNPYVERYNRSVRHVWGQLLFETIQEVQDHATDLQQRQTQHGHRRHHARPEIETGRVSSMFEPR